MTTIAEWQRNDLIALLRNRYPDWEDFRHPDFVADEIAPKQASVDKMRQLLSPDAFDELISQQAFDEVISRLEKLSRHNNLLFTKMPAKGDAGILYHPNLNHGEFALAMQKLLYGSRPSEQRLAEFAAFARANRLPLKWAFPTYFLFLTHPTEEYFIKPNAAKWFLRFMGAGDNYSKTPTSDAYAFMRGYAGKLLDELSFWGAADFIDIQSFLWVCFQESKAKIAGLTPKQQIELGAPPTDEPVAYHIQTADKSLREEDEMKTNRAPAYPLKTFGAESGYSEEELAQWVAGIERKKQAIFYGPPGVGKTFLAQKFAQHLVGGGDGIVQLIQFHPAYSYEEFIQGIRPVTGEDGALSYEMKEGRFLAFCRQARGRNGLSVLIIDEINRANLGQLFGELMIALEYREQPIQLASGEPFAVPRNVRVIGTMNTADRSIALVDYALRRRFAFIPLHPNFEALRHYHAQTGFKVDGLIKLLARLNAHIEDPHYALGVSYFLLPDLAEQLPNIWQMEIEPYLEEYFFNQPAKVEQFRWEQVKSDALG